MGNYSFLRRREQVESLKVTEKTETEVVIKMKKPYFENTQKFLQDNRSHLPHTARVYAGSNTIQISSVLIGTVEGMLNRANSVEIIYRKVSKTNL